jgi:2-haloacid dehalogenase
VSLDEVAALTFDVFGTVVDWRSSIVRELRGWFGPRGIERDWEAVADRWRALYQPAMEEVRRGRRPWTRLDDLHRDNLRVVLAEFGLAGLNEPEIEHLNRAWHRLDPWPDAVDGLTRLRRRFILATLSNGNVALLVNMAKRAGLPWDAILGAEVARAYKPMPEAYARRVPAARDQPAVDRRGGRRLVEMEGLRVPAPGKRDDLVARERAPAQMVHLAGGEIVEVDGGHAWRVLRLR